MNTGEKYELTAEIVSLRKRIRRKIGVSDKTISSWENSRTMPDLEMLSLLHHTLGLPIDFPSIESATESIEPTLPDEPLVNKKSYSSKQPSHSKDTIFLSARLLFGLSFLINYQYKMKRSIDSILFETTNRLYHTPVGYVDNSIERWVCNDIFGHGTWLSFHAGEVEKRKPCCNQTQRKTRHERSPAHLGSHSLRLPRNPQPRL